MTKRPAKRAYQAIKMATGFGLYEHAHIPEGAFVVHHFSANECLAVDSDGTMREIKGLREAANWLRMRHIAREVRDAIQERGPAPVHVGEAPGDRQALGGREPGTAQPAEARQEA